ncbi:UNVERIFIED_CONTAM: hypothetical protein HDU68_007073 [Siphonaria sp. JEL0065]|nr:hypothetical protein HDU68_007073 [Siphonaria sp. JEL0065]
MSARFAQLCLARARAHQQPHVSTSLSTSKSVSKPSRLPNVLSKVSNLKNILELQQLQLQLQLQQPLSTVTTKPTTTTNSCNTPILLCDSLRTLSKTIHECTRDSRIIAFDAEWKISMRRGVPQPKISLLQIYNGHTVGLFRLNCLTDGFQSSVPAELCHLIQGPSGGIVKVGLNIRGDAAKLFRDYGLQLTNYIELMTLAKEKCPNLLTRNPETGALQKPSLQHLTSKLLGYNLDKSNNLRLGNWESKTLAPLMIEYAAADVVASYQVYKAMEKMHWNPLVEDYTPKDK